MTREAKTRDQLLREHAWKPIRGCPGRLVRDGVSDQTVEELVGLDGPLPLRSNPLAPDPLVIVGLADGGVISYRKPGGLYLHTLATPEAFARKLRQLGYEPTGES